MKRISVYKCEECGNIGTKAQVYKCEKYHSEQAKKNEKQNKEQAEIEKLGMVPLGAESLEEAIKLLKKGIKEYYGVTVDFVTYPKQFGHTVINTHSCPIDGVINWTRDKKLPLSYPGWYGTWEGRITGKNKDYIGFGRLFATDTNEGIFQGFHTGTGTGGTNFCMTGKIFLDDFPKIRKRYDNYLSLKEQRKVYDSKYNTIVNNSRQKFLKSKYYTNNRAKADKLDDECELTKNKAIHDALDKEAEALAKVDYDRKAYNKLQKEFDAYVPL